MVQALLSISAPLGADAADALAAGLCRGQARRVHLLVARAPGLGAPR